MSEETRSPQRDSTPDYQWTSQTWKPLLVLGAVVLLGALAFPTVLTNAQERAGASSDRNTFSDVAILSGVKRTNLSSDFESGRATAVLGGVEIDLSDATMEGSEAVLNVSSVMGGVKVRVPEDWTVVSRVNAILGGYKDDTRRPWNEEHRLVLKGTVFMGGLQVTN